LRPRPEMVVEVFDERVAPRYSRSMTRNMRSILQNLKYDIVEHFPELLEMSDRELAEWFQDMAFRRFGYSRSTTRSFTRAFALTIREMRVINSEVGVEPATIVY